MTTWPSGLHEHPVHEHIGMLEFHPVILLPSEKSSQLLIELRRVRRASSAEEKEAGVSVWWQVRDLLLIRGHYLLQFDSVYIEIV